MKGSGALQVDWGACAVVHTKALVCIASQRVSSSLQRISVGLCVCVRMLGNQYMPQWFWQLSSQRFPIPKSDCLSSSSISPSAVLYCPTQYACLLSKQHFGSQNKPTISFSDLPVHQPQSCEHFSRHCFWFGCVCLLFQQKQQGTF